MLSVGNIEPLGAELRLEGGVAVRHGPPRDSGRNCHQEVKSGKQEQF